MVNQAIILRKISIIRECLSKLEKNRATALDAFLKDSDVQDIVLHNLLLALQASIDLGAHIVADEGWGVPGSQAEIFSIFKDKGIISEDLLKEMIPATGLRNILIHEYGEVNLSIVHNVINEKIKFIDEYLKRIVEYFHLT